MGVAGTPGRRRRAPAASRGRRAASAHTRAPATLPRGSFHPPKATQLALRQIVERREEVIRSMQLLRESWVRVREWDAQLGATQDALARAHARFAEFYDFVPTPFLALDGRLRITQINQAGAALLRGTRFVGLPLVAFVAQEDFPRLLEAFGRLRPHDVEYHELRVRSAHGLVPVQLVMKASEPASLGKDEHAGREAEAARAYYVALIDLTELRRLEQERKKSAEAESAALATARAKDDFIAMLSHELRTPLAPILSAAEALAAAGLRGMLGEAAAMIRRNVLIEANLIDDLLDAARVTQNRLHVERRPLSLHRLIEGVAADWAPEYARDELTLRLELRARRDAIQADPARVAQVLRNVLVNAAKFTPAGGRITIRTEEVDGFVRASINDTGQGMTADEIQRLFEPFQVARGARFGRAGLGLGLAICRGIVEAHGGHIRAHSPGPQRGTTIEIELPATDQEVAADAPPVTPTRPIAATRSASARARAERRRHARHEPASHQPPAPGPGRRVLLVEDHEDSAETLALILTMKGYQVTVARSLAEAIALAPGCDMVISDISLPDGSGLDLMRRLRREPALPAIAMSGYGTELDQRRSREAGFAEHLTKPVNIDRLLDTLRRIAPPPPPSS